MEAWIIRPAGFEEGKRYPVLLNIHGGPFTQYGNGFFDEFQVYAGAGYAVVYSNPRGSSGYTEEWGRAIRGRRVGGPGWGTVDYEDVMAVIEEALERFDFMRSRARRRDGRLVRRLHDLLDRRATPTASRPPSRSARSTTGSRCTARATSAGSSRATSASSSTRTSTPT